ncbi:hypothetical protein N5K27_05960 [Pigmentiphaga sp. GD03639]|uniref:Uncharacterized protein n=1 Tax=Pigmentiphaga daeguensis TaxID=414049 RepID=A0ABP3MJK9_9BURK|nr:MULTISPECIES: hypothetical protein [unclassified Pigmentiphaga]MDH2235839.1 hypothetical protein [Pigmentiphaga sp. GD03639]
MRRGRGLLGAGMMVALGACGGGDSGDGGGPAAVQQYPAGIYTGKAGPLATQRDFIGIVDGGRNGTGGNFYFALDTGTSRGYDGLYGGLSVTLATLRATNATYYSTVDGKFVANGVTVSGIVTGAASAENPGARISGNYSNPAGTAAATSSPLVPFTLDYREDLYVRASSLATMAGTYQGGGPFGGAWNMTVDTAGRLTGSNSGCALTGSVSTPNPARGVYGIVLNLAGTGCSRPGSTQTGWAVLTYDAKGAKSGIWVFTTDADSKALNTFILNGLADNSVEPPDPATPQFAEGYWTPTSGAFEGVVTPDSYYFLYRRNGAGYDVLSGRLTRVAGSNSKMTDEAATFYSAQGTTAATSLNGTVIGDAFTGSFADPAAGNAATQFAMAKDGIYQAAPARLAAVAGKSYQTPSLEPLSMTVNVAADGVLSGSREACRIVDSSTDGGPISRIGPYPGITTQNLFQVKLIFTGAACAGSEDGIAVAVYDPGAQTAKGLRIFTLGTLTSSTQRVAKVAQLATPAP